MALYKKNILVSGLALLSFCLSAQLRSFSVRAGLRARAIGRISRVSEKKAGGFRVSPHASHAPQSFSLAQTYTGQKRIEKGLHPDTNHGYKAAKAEQHARARAESQNNLWRPGSGVLWRETIGKGYQKRSFAFLAEHLDENLTSSIVLDHYAAVEDLPDMISELVIKLAAIFKEDCDDQSIDLFLARLKEHVARLIELQKTDQKKYERSFKFLAEKNSLGVRVLYYASDLDYYELTNHPGYEMLINSLPLDEAPTCEEVEHERDLARMLIDSIRVSWRYGCC